METRWGKKMSRSSVNHCDTLWAAVSLWEQESFCSWMGSCHISLHMCKWWETMQNSFYLLFIIFNKQKSRASYQVRFLKASVEFWGIIYPSNSNRLDALITTVPSGLMRPTSLSDSFILVRMSSAKKTNIYFHLSPTLSHKYIHNHLISLSISLM